jgi:hypothetical protein
MHYEIPPDAQASTCRGCEAPIYWVVSPKGRNVPVDEDGTCHFDTCPNADAFKRRTPYSPKGEPAKSTQTYECKSCERYRDRIRELEALLKDKAEQGEWLPF